MKIPPGTPRSRSFTRLTMRVGLPHLGQSVLLDVSMTFLRSAVLAIFAILCVSPDCGLPQMGGNGIWFGSKLIVARASRPPRHPARFCERRFRPRLAVH